MEARCATLVSSLGDPTVAAAAAHEIRELIDGGETAFFISANAGVALASALVVGVEDASLCADVCAALGLLSLVDGTSLAFLNKHGAHALTIALETHLHDANVCCAVCGAIPSVIGGLSPKKFLCDALVNSGILTPLANALRARAVWLSRREHPDDERVCAAVCGALTALKMRPAHGKDFVAAGVPSCLASVLQARLSNDAVFADAMHILNSVYDTDCLMPTDLCVTIVDCLSAHTGAFFSTDCFALLETIAQNPSAAAIPRERFVDIIMSRLTRDRDSVTTCREALSSLRELALEPHSIRSILLRNGALPQVLNCIRPHVQDADLCAHAAEFVSLLLTFSASERLQTGPLIADFVAAGTIEILCTFLRRHPSNADITCFCCSALASIAEDAELTFVAPCVSSSAPALICAALEEQRYSPIVTLSEAVRALRNFVTGGRACVDQVFAAGGVAVLCGALGAVAAAGAVRSSMFTSALLALKYIAAAGPDICATAAAPVILVQMVAHPAQQDLAIDVIKLLADGTDAQRKAVLAAGALGALRVNSFDGRASASQSQRAMQVFVDVADSRHVSSTAALATDAEDTSAESPFTADVLCFADNVVAVYKLHKRVDGVCFETARALAFLSDAGTLEKYGGDRLLEKLFEKRAPTILSALLHAHVTDVHLCGHAARALANLVDERRCSAVLTPSMRISEVVAAGAEVSLSCALRSHSLVAGVRDAAASALRVITMRLLPAGPPDLAVAPPHSLVEVEGGRHKHAAKAREDAASDTEERGERPLVRARRRR